MGWVATPIELLKLKMFFAESYVAMHHSCCDNEQALRVRNQEVHFKL